MSGWSARSVAAFLLRNRSGLSQVVVGILLSSEELLWSVAVHTPVAEGRAYITSSGMEFVAVEVPKDQLVESMPSQIEEFVEQADVEAVVGLEGWQENPSRGIGEVIEAWGAHYTSAAESASPAGAPVSRQAARGESQAQAFSMGIVDSFEMLDHAGRGPMGSGASVFASTASIPGSGSVPPPSGAPVCHDGGRLTLL